MSHEFASNAEVDFHPRHLYDKSTSSFGQKDNEVNVSSMEFQNPLLPSGQDPFVTYHDGNYHYLHAGASLGWTPVYLSVAPSLTGLRTAERIPVWTPPQEGEASTDTWAPEMHRDRIDGKWWMYAAAWSGKAGDPHRMYAFEGGKDPREGFSMKSEIIGTQTAWGIDGTLLQDGDRTYYLWSGKERLTIDPTMPTGISYTNPDTQHLFIAEMKSPWELTGPSVKISSPTFDWEFSEPQPVNEAPQVLLNPKMPKRTMLGFSAGHTLGPDYKQGLLVNDSGDFLNPASWNKVAQPLFSRTEDVYGPGHPSFVATPHGEHWIVYHSAKEEFSGLDRQVNAQPFTWSSDGFPLFGQPVSPREVLIDTTAKSQNEHVNLYSQPLSAVAD